MLRFEPREILIDKKKIIRFLGYNQNSKPYNKILKIIDMEIENARSLLDPKGIYKIFDADRFEEKLFKDGEKVALAVVTIGEDLEKEVQRLFEEVEGTRGLILDAVGSAATEETANLLNREIIKEAEKEGLKTTRRFSPGYGRWSQEGQDFIFKNIEEVERELGVVLNPSMVMMPVKSTSFAVKMGKSYMEEINQGQCRDCHLKEDCLRNRTTPLCSVLPSKNI